MLTAAVSRFALFRSGARVARAAAAIACALAIGLLPAVGAASDAPIAESDPIVLDGLLDDWQGVPVAHLDPSRDGRDDADSHDFGILQLAHDDHHLLLRVTLAQPVLLQHDNALRLIVDADDDPTTGTPLRGLGAELVWQFGLRRGLVHFGGETHGIEHEAIGLVTAPTTDDVTFEIALARDAEPVPGRRLFTGPAVRVALIDGTAGDALPNAGGVGHRFDGPARPSPAPIALDRAHPDARRLVSYNVNGRLQQAERRAAFGRVLRALQPDVLMIQELRRFDAAEAVGYLRGLGVLDHVRPSARDQRVWHYARSGEEGNLVVSTTPIRWSLALGGSAAFLLDGRAADEPPLLLIVLSAPCCDRDAERQVEYDRIAAFLRDVRGDGARDDDGAVRRVDAGTPVMVMGDANLVGDRRQRATLLDGAIADAARFGPSAGPDAGASLIDAVPRHTHRPLASTWHGSDFSPGRLDYIAYGASRLALDGAYVLDTAHLPDDVRDAHALEPGDTAIASDHLPLVADVRPRPPTR
ncbi:MAG: endonuclease/exonuclease/phosphatase family protein [Acidobacteriota bacterium]